MSRAKAWRRAALATYIAAGAALTLAGYTVATTAANANTLRDTRERIEDFQREQTAIAENSISAASVRRGTLPPDTRPPVAPDWPALAERAMPSVVALAGIDKPYGTGQNNHAWRIPGVQQNAATAALTRIRAWHRDWPKEDAKRRQRIICGGVVGGPAITVLMRRFGISGSAGNGAAAGAGSGEADESVHVHFPNESAREFDALKSIVVLLMAMWLGVWVGKGFEGIGLTLPTYIGAMLVGAVIRNIDDYTGWIKLSVPTTDLIGNICLALFLAIALMDLKLWELAGMGLPLVVNLVIQVALVALFAVPIYYVMGRDYDAAVMGGGFIGFMLGTTANAMAVMRRLAQRYGPAPRAFLVAPLVGAFFIDFINALIITGFLNFWPH